MEFQETVITGGSTDFAEVRHAVLRGSNREVGRKIAEIARRRHKVRPAPASDTLRTRCRNAYFQRNYPQHYERMRGAAEAYDLPFPNDSTDIGELWYNLDTAPGCSVVYYPPAYTASGHVLPFIEKR